MKDLRVRLEDAAVLEETIRTKATSTAFGSDNHTQYINIPKVIYCNHWMLGVDVADQLIAYCRPRIRCRRTWISLMSHCLDIIRINTFIITKRFSTKKVVH